MLFWRPSWSSTGTYSSKLDSPSPKEHIIKSFWRKLHNSQKQWKFVEWKCLTRRRKLQKYRRLTLKKGTFSFSRNGVDRQVRTGALCFPYWKISKLLIYYNFTPSTNSWKPCPTKTSDLLDEEKNRPFYLVREMSKFTMISSKCKNFDAKTLLYYSRTFQI